MMGHSAVGHVRIPMNSGTWWRLNANGKDPVEELRTVALEQMRAWRLPYREDELQFVREDPVFQESTHNAYWSARADFDQKMRLPGHLTIRFQRPGTRDSKEREVGT